MKIFNSVGNWFVDTFKSIGSFLSDIFEPIVTWFNEFFEPVKEFFVNNSRNPFLWVGIIVLGLLVFEIVYKALNKD